VPLPSYSPIGNGIAIGTYGTPKEINVPGTDDLLAVLAPGDKRKVTHLEKNFVIVGWSGTDPTGAAVSDADAVAPIMCVVDADGKFELHVDCDPKNTGVNAVIDVVSGFVDFDKGVVSISSSRSAEANGKVTKVKCVCAATSSEHNIAPRIVFDSKQVKFQARDVQLQSEWSEQYAYDMSKRTGMDAVAELTTILGNQTQLTINKTILDDILFAVGRHGDNIRKFSTDPKKARTAFAYTRKEWANELMYHIEKCSARIYSATNNMEATHIVVNPEDLVWFQMLDSFVFNGDYVKGGVYGRANVGTISNGKQIISTPLMPAGYILLASKPADTTLANYIFGATRSIVKSYSMEMAA